MSELDVRIQLLRAQARLPAYETPGAAAMDLAAALDTPVAIAAGETVLVPTGIAIALPGRGWAALIFARSGLSVRAGLVPANAVGVIDADYRGEIMVPLRNHSAETAYIAPGQRIAQMAVVPVASVHWEQTDTLDETARGTGGFGSTGTG